MATLNSIYRYPGAKARLLPVILPSIENILIGKESFADCFVGGGSVAIEVAKKYKDIKIYLNDKNYNIYSFWKIVSEDNQAQIADLCSLLKTHPTLDLFYSLKKERTADLIRSAYIGIFLNRCSFSGMGINPIGGKNQKSKYKVDCRYNSDKIIKKINDLNKLFKNRTIVSNKDINEYIPNLDINIPIYLDPPYYKVGKDLYNIHMDDNEHQQLSELLLNRKYWVLSYDNHPRIIDLYKSKNINYIDAKYSINGIKTQWSEKQELLIAG